mgnify:CR=1 FL=1
MSFGFANAGCKPNDFPSTKFADGIHWACSPLKLKTKININ